MSKKLTRDELVRRLNTAVAGGDKRQIATYRGALLKRDRATGYVSPEQVQGTHRVGKMWYESPTVHYVDVRKMSELQRLSVLEHLQERGIKRIRFIYSMHQRDPKNGRWRKYYVSTSGEGLSNNDTPEELAGLLAKDYTVRSGKAGDPDYVDGSFSPDTMQYIVWDE